MDHQTHGGNFVKS